jgi:hypothetical protein
VSAAGGDPAGDLGGDPAGDLGGTARPVPQRDPAGPAAGRLVLFALGGTTRCPVTTAAG